MGKNLAENISSIKFVLKQINPETCTNVTLDFKDVFAVENDDNFFYVMNDGDVIIIAVSEVLMMTAYKKGAAR